MKFYKCDWCNKEIEEPIKQNLFFETGLIDLCEECNKKYTTIEKELIEYENKLSQEFKNKILKKKEELIKKESQ